MGFHKTVQTFLGRLYFRHAEQSDMAKKWGTSRTFCPTAPTPTLVLLGDRLCGMWDIHFDACGGWPASPPGLYFPERTDRAWRWFSTTLTVWLPPNSPSRVQETGFSLTNFSRAA